MRTDRKAVRLGAQTLQEVKDGIALVEGERGSAGNEKALAPRVTVGPLGNPNNRDVVNAELGEHAPRHVQLTLAAVDQHEIRPHGALSFRVFLQSPGEA